MESFMQPPKPLKVGEKRVKEPSSHATTSGQGRSTALSRASLTKSFSNLSISGKDSSKGPVALFGGIRDRSDSNCSKPSDSSALDRFLGKYCDPGMVSITTSVVLASHDRMEFTVMLHVLEFGSKEWKIHRTVADVLALCDSIRGSGAGLSFPMPPPATEMLNAVERAPGTEVRDSRAYSAGADYSEPMTTDSNKSHRGKMRHQKKKANTIMNTTGLMRVMSSRFMTRRTATRSPEKTCSSVQEWIDAALETWQRQWQSKSDEDGISLALEAFLCDRSNPACAAEAGKVPKNLVTALDSQIVTSGTASDNAQLRLNREREAVITRAALRQCLLPHSKFSIEELKARVLTYAWTKYEETHEMKPGMPPNPHDNDLLSFLFLDVQQRPGKKDEMIFSWAPHPQLTTLKLNLIENISVPSTPKSAAQGHFFEVWKSFSEIVVNRAYERLLS